MYGNIDLNVIDLKWKNDGGTVMKYFVPAEFNDLKMRVIAEYKERGVFFLDEGYILSFHKKTNAFPRTLQALLKGAREVAACEDAALYTLFLCRAMEDHALFLRLVPHIEIPDEDFPFLAMLSALPYIEALYEDFSQKSLPADVLADTIGQYEECMFLYEERFGRLGMSKRYFAHMQGYAHCHVLNIGRLRFELHTLKDACMLEHKRTGEQILFVPHGEFNASGLYADTPPIRTDDDRFTAFFEEREHAYIGTAVNARGRCMPDAITLEKEDYFVRLSVGSTCLSVHIPAKGALTREACVESYRRARKIFSSLYPDRDIKAFRCHSWMMSPELEEILKPGSNLLAFQAPYLKYPCRTKGEDIFNFVFKTKPTDLAKLPEDSSLQRALKERYLSGGYLYEYNGIFTV